MNKKSLLLLIPFTAAALAGCKQADKKQPDDPQPGQCESVVVSISKKTLDLHVGGTHTLSVYADPATCSLEGKWVSDAPSVASVNENTGEVTALAEGEANIKFGNYSGAVCKVTVTAGEDPDPVVHVESIAFAKDEYEIEKDDELTLSVSVTPSNAANKNVSYDLSNVSPAGSVSIDGNKVKGLIPGGQATVTATSEDGGKTATAVIKVKSESPKPSPVHAGDASDPYDGADAALVAENLESGKYTSESFYIKDEVTEIIEGPEGYGNYTFMFGAFKCFRLKNGSGQASFNTGDIEVGDIVTVYAQIQKYGDHDELETKGGYVVDVHKEGEATPVSIQSVKSCPDSIGQGKTLSASSIVITILMSDDSTQDVNPTSVLCDTSVGDKNVEVTLGYMSLQPITTSIYVTPKAPVTGDAVYTFTNDKKEAQNMGSWTSEQFMNHVSVEGAEIISGMKGVTNAYIGGNGGSGDSSWNIWNCLKVGKSSAKGEITLLLEEEANFDKIKVSAIGSRDDGTLTINDITKNVTKKAVKTDLEPIELEYEIAGGVKELKLSSKDAASNNYGILITKIEFVCEAEATLESITADMTKKTYTEGDLLSLEGLSVIGHYSDGSDAEITEGVETSMEEGKILALGDTSLEVSVGDVKTTITLTIIDQSVTLDSLSISGVKDKYYVGEKLGEVVVTAHYSDGSTPTVSAELKIGDAVVGADHEMVLGENKIVASYDGVTAEKSFEVVEDTVVSIAVSSEHRSFNVGEEFVKETVTATYESGATKDVTGEASFTGYKMDVADTYTITVSYSGKSTTYSITVSEEQRESLPYKGLVENGALPEKWELTGSGATFATSYYALKASGAAITASKLFSEKAAIKVGVKGVCNGTTTDSLVTVYALNDNGTVVDSDTYVPVKASASNATQVEANSTLCEVSLAGTGITGVKVELTTKGHNYVLMSVSIEEDVPPVPPVLQSISATTSDHRSFYLDQEFVPETIMATYDKGDDQDVTAEATFTGYDMSSAGKQTVAVSFGGKETSYEIEVSSAPVPVVDVTGVSLNEADLDLVVDEEATLVATVAPADASNKNVTWLSDNESVATVVDGVVTAVGEGEATITVTTVDQGKTATCTVTVSPKPAPTGDTTLDFTQIEGFSEWTNSYSQHIVEYTDVIVTFDGASKQGSTISNMPVGKDAPVTIVAKEGKNLNYFSAEFAKWNTNNQTVNVEYSTDFGKTFVSLDVSTTTFAIEKTNLPKGTSAIRFKPVDSKQIGYSKVVTNIISAQTPDPVAVTGVSLDNTELTLGPTKSEQLVATVAPINATNKNVVWSVIEGNEFVSVDQTGVVTGLKVGEGVVQVATVDGNFEATCKVTVSDDAPTTKEATLDLTGTKTSWDPLTVAKGENATYTVGEFKFTVYGGTASTACTANYSESYRTYSGSYIEISLPSDSKYASFASMTMNAGSKSASDNGGYKISASTIDDVTGTIKAATSSPAAVVVSDLKGATVIRVSCTSGQLRYVSFNFVMNLK